MLERSRPLPPPIDAARPSPCTLASARGPLRPVIAIPFADQPKPLAVGPATTVKDSGFQARSPGQETFGCECGIDIEYPWIVRQVRDDLEITPAAPNHLGSDVFELVQGTASTPRADGSLKATKPFYPVSFLGQRSTLRVHQLRP